jgi:hypothetical protein
MEVKTNTKNHTPKIIGVKDEPTPTKAWINIQNPKD